MCGIVGVISKKRSAEKALKLIEMINYRGPDHKAVFSHDLVSVGMCQLQIRLPMSQMEIIPFLCNDQRVVAYNGEVYSDDLKSGREEAEYLLDMVNKKSGSNCMASLIINDNDKITLYRDQFGIKPLFYSFHENNTAACSSELTALCNIEDSLKIDDDTLLEIACFGNSLGKNTLFRDIYSVDPGEIIKIDLNGIKSDFVEENKCFSDEKLIDHIRESVKLCTLGNRKMFLALSGGIDSTILAYVLNELDVENIETISIHIEGSEDYVSDLKELKMPEGGAWEKWKHHVVPFSAEDFKECLKESVEIFGMPTYMTSITLYYALAKKAKELGCIVMLTGEGADEMFLGYNTYTDLKNTDDFLKKITGNGRISILKQLFGEERIDKVTERFYNTFDTKSSDIAQVIREIEKKISLQPLLQRQDHIFMRFGIEGRTPFLHSDIPLMAERIKYEDLVSGTETKKALKQILHDIYGFKGIKKKTAFRSPINEWFNGELRSWICEQLIGYKHIYNALKIKEEYVDEIVSSSEWTDDETKVIFFLITLGCYMSNPIIDQRFSNDDISGKAM